MRSVRSMSAMSCISRPVNAIGMAPRPIRRWGISRSQPLAVKPAGDSFPLPGRRGSASYGVGSAAPLTGLVLPSGTRPFPALGAGEPETIVVLPDPVTIRNRQSIIGFAVTWYRPHPQRGEVRRPADRASPRPGRRRGRSGNTGIGLAMVCAQKGYPLVVTMADSFSIERRKLMRILGAKVVLTPRALKGMGMYQKAVDLAK